MTGGVAAGDGPAPMVAPGMLLALVACAESPGEEIEGVELSWDAPPPCVTAEELRRMTGLLLADRSAPAEPVGVAARVRPEGAGGFTLELELTTSTGNDTRRISASQCEELARATALIVATMADPIAVARHYEGLEDGVGPLPPAASSRPPASAAEVPVDAEEDGLAPDVLPLPQPSRPTTPRRRRIAVQGSLRVEGIAGYAGLPRVDGGLGIAAAVVGLRFRAELGARHYFAQRRPHPQLLGVALDVRLTTAIMRGCGVPAVGRWEFPVCGGAELGSMAARGQGERVVGSSLQRSPYAAVLVDANVVFRPTPRLGLWLGAEGALNATRPRFTIEGEPAFFLAPAGGGRATLGLEVRFP